MPTEFEHDAALFKALSDPLRLRLLDALPGSAEKHAFCVGELAEKLGVSQPCLSHHLNILKNAGLVGFEKNGCSTFYYVEEKQVAGRLQDFQVRLKQ